MFNLNSSVAEQDSFYRTGGSVDRAPTDRSTDVESCGAVSLPQKQGAYPDREPVSSESEGGFPPFFLSIMEVPEKVRVRSARPTVPQYLEKRKCVVADHNDGDYRKED